MGTDLGFGRLPEGTGASAVADRACGPSDLSRFASQPEALVPLRKETGPFLFTRRAWAMPNRDTFSIGPIRAFIRPYVERLWSSVDPFARRSELALVTNDLNPDMPTNYHMDAEAFCKEMARQEKVFDLAFFDPPYSPRQISECYKGVGLPVGTKETQNAALYCRVRNALLPILSPRAVVLSFGWNSNGMGRSRGFELLELMLVAHGAAHNDTICLAEQRVAQ